MWLEHGGSGLGMQWSEVNSLDYEDLRDLWIERAEQRQREAEAIKNASRTPPV